jgi:hypothetical protein
MVGKTTWSRGRKAQNRYLNNNDCMFLVTTLSFFGVSVGNVGSVCNMNGTRSI